MDLNIINVATYYGCDKKGVDLGPEVLMDNKLIEILTSCGHNINKIIDIHIDQNNVDKFNDNKNIKYFNKIFSCGERLRDEIKKSYKKNIFPLIIGGDHSISIGSLAGFSSSFEDGGVIWVDAHGDLNTHHTSPSSNAHGMPLACSLGYGHEKLLSLFDRNIDPKNVFLFGIRSLDKGEKHFIINNEMHLYDINSFKCLNHDLMINTMRKYTEKNNIKNFHLSFDIDVLDPSLVPGTGTPVKSGLMMDQLEDFLHKLTSSVNIVSMDFVEFNPLLDKNNKTLKICLRVLEFFFRRISK